MKYCSMFFLGRISWLLRVVLVATALWFIVALLMTNGGTRNAITGGSQAVEYDEAEPNAMKVVKPSPSKKRSEFWNVSSLSEGFGVITYPGLDNAPGELGKPVVLPENISGETIQAVNEGWKNHFFNQYVSDLISIRRKLPDARHEWCKSYQYLADLPQTSVIICFHDEAWSTLLRTVHSVLDRSPPHLLKEIVLVDDFSDMLHLKKQLDDYMSSVPKVRIVRPTRREGLIRARLLGARHATAPVLTFLDSHCECAEGWLEPLLDRIARNKSTVVCPNIDVIDDNTFEFLYEKSIKLVGGFNWNLEFVWLPILDREIARHKHIAEPVWTPTMAGGLFAIDKEFFEHLGTYDSDFDIWGGENLELSFKTWMCGGTLEVVPCSHVGHVFRKNSPYRWKTDVNVKKKNDVRLAEVWLDDYAIYYYQQTAVDKVDIGDISSRVALRKKLGCKPFDWYLKNIYPELFIPRDLVARGEIANIEAGMCIDSDNEHKNMWLPVGAWPCHGHSGKQYWYYTKTGEIRRDDTCLDYHGRDVTLLFCHRHKGNQMWLYEPQMKLLMHGPTKLCMAINESEHRVVMETCNNKEKRQIWYLENFKPERLSPELMALI